MLTSVEIAVAVGTAGYAGAAEGAAASITATTASTITGQWLRSAAKPSRNSHLPPATLPTPQFSRAILAIRNFAPTPTAHATSGARLQSLCDDRRNAEAQGNRINLRTAENLYIYFPLRQLRPWREKKNREPPESGQKSTKLVQGSLLSAFFFASAAAKCLVATNSVNSTARWAGGLSN